MFDTLIDPNFDFDTTPAPAPRRRLTRGDDEILGFWLWTVFVVAFVGVALYIPWHIREDVVTLTGTSVSTGYGQKNIVHTSKGSFELSSERVIWHGGKTELAADYTFGQLQKLPINSKITVKWCGIRFGDHIVSVSS